MYEHETNEGSIRQMVLENTQAGEVYLHELSTGSPYSRRTMDRGIFSFVALLDNFNEFLQGTATSEFADRELITDFSGEPYTALRGIPITVRSIDAGEGFEVSWDEANIAMVGDSKIEAIHALTENILYTMEALEENENCLAPEPKRQLNVLRTYLKHTP